MQATLDRLKFEISSLTDVQRAELAEFVLASLDDEGEGEPDVETAWDDEAARRVEAMLRDDPACKPAAQLFAEMREKYS